MYIRKPYDANDRIGRTLIQWEQDIDKFLEFAELSNSTPLLWTVEIALVGGKEEKTKTP